MDRTVAKMHTHLFRVRDRVKVRVRVKVWVRDACVPKWWVRSRRPCGT